MKAPRLDFAGFNGTVVLASSHVRKCAKCKRMIGRGHGYSYGYGRRVDVCDRCHMRNFKRSRAAKGFRDFPVRERFCSPACRDAGRPLHPGTPSTPRGSR